MANARDKKVDAWLKKLRTANERGDKAQLRIAKALEKKKGLK